MLKNVEKMEKIVEKYRNCGKNLSMRVCRDCMATEINKKKEEDAEAEKLRNGTINQTDKQPPSTDEKPPNKKRHTIINHTE